MTLLYSYSLASAALVVQLKTRFVNVMSKTFSCLNPMSISGRKRCDSETIQNDISMVDMNICIERRMV